MTIGDDRPSSRAPAPGHHPPAQAPGAHGAAAPCGRRAPRPVTVACAPGSERPRAVVLGRRRLPVDEVLEVWVVETGWWRDEGPLRQVVWRVRAGGRVLDLCRDRRRGTWSLARVLG